MTAYTKQSPKIKRNKKQNTKKKKKIGYPKKNASELCDIIDILYFGISNDKNKNNEASELKLAEFDSNSNS